MNSFRSWLTPGSLVLAMFVVLIWLHRMHLPLAPRGLAQIGLVCLTYAGLWALTGGQAPRQ